jgi:GT2 family glycosyltransferase
VKYLPEPTVSIIIPTFNGASRIAGCLDALLQQKAAPHAEILVVDDGSTDKTAEIVKQYSNVRLVSQANAGPAAARNRGALEARGEIVLFTDDDCIPASGWLTAMIAPFEAPGVVGVKGAYRTRQKQLVARFVQIEYEDRYRRMARFSDIDFIDTYSAAFRCEAFLEAGGFDTDFPVACAEDAELSYRMSARGWRMKFAPDAVVYHTHPETLSKYLAKKYKFAFWRVLAVRKNPHKAVADSHTPQLMKLQLLFPLALLLAVSFDLVKRPSVPTTGIVLVAFLLSTLPFAARAMKKDPIIGLLSPIVLTLRSCAQTLGVTAGIGHAHRGSVQVQTKPAA